uniref:Uncharacterized protein n=1 Tax=Trypanosoma congolense (strain IL3000) TaxID=1068625 RepID=G0UY17_TRYCI|nr:conserved hypothetical protein [Trypanosoma congolense IL3000]
MEINFGARVALLATHKTYCDDGDNTVKCVASYPPFMSYLEECRVGGPTPSSFLIRDVRRMARRIVGVILDVECLTDTGKMTQTVELSDHSPAILLPVARVEETKYALLVRHRCTSAGCGLTTEAFCGLVDGGGATTWYYSDLLTEAGFNLGQLDKVGSRKYSVGNEGSPPYDVFTIEQAMTPSAIEAIHQAAAGAADASLVAVPMEDVVLTINDAKAALAVSLVMMRG